MVLDQLSNWRKYRWSRALEQAFGLLAGPDAAKWPDGRVELDGKRIVALPQGYATRDLRDGRWEAHRRYIDIQYIVSGGEKMGWAPLVTLAPETPFDAEKDVGFYLGEGDF